MDQNESPTLSATEIKEIEDLRKFWKDFKKDFIAGSASGAAVTLTTQPLDTIAVRSQAGSSDIPYKRFTEAFRPMNPARNLEGFAKVKNLYKGVTPRLLKSTAAGAIGYPVFMAAADKLERNGETKTAAALDILTKSTKLGGIANFAILGAAGLLAPRLGKKTILEANTIAKAAPKTFTKLKSTGNRTGALADNIINGGDV